MIGKLSSLVTRLGRRMQPLALLLLRLAWGWQLVESALGHLTNFSKTADYFRGLGIPSPGLSAAMSASTELVGGALLILGLYARLASVPLLVNFCVAYAFANRAALGELLHLRPDDFINDSAFPFLLTSLLVIAFGPGRISVDAKIGNEG